MPRSSPLTPLVATPGGIAPMLVHDADQDDLVAS
jgi:hypothetical protein